MRYALDVNSLIDRPPCGDRIAHRAPLWTEHLSFPLHLDPVTAVHDGQNGAAAAQWRPNAEVPVELAIGFDTGGASASGGTDVDYGARREIRSQHTDTGRSRFGRRAIVPGIDIHGWHV